MRNLTIKDLPLLKELDGIPHDLLFDWKKHSGRRDPLADLEWALQDTGNFRKIGRTSFVLGIGLLLFAWGKGSGIDVFSETPFMRMPIVEALELIATPLFFAGAAFLLSLMYFVKPPSSMVAIEAAQKFVEDVNELRRVFDIPSHGRLFQLGMSLMREQAEANLSSIACSVVNLRAQAVEDPMPNHTRDAKITRLVTRIDSNYDLFARFGLVERTSHGYKPYFDREIAKRSERASDVGVQAVESV